MNSKELAIKRSASGKRRRIFSAVAGSIGLGVLALGLAFGLSEGIESFWIFLVVGAAFSSVAAIVYRPWSADHREDKRRHRRDRSSPT